MIRQVVQRLLLLVPVLFVVLLVTFVILQFAAGDPAKIYWRTHAGNMTPTPEQLEEIRQKLGLNDPQVVQFARWVGSVLRLDLGRTLWTNQLVLDELRARLPYTLALAGAALALAVAISVPLGVVSAARPGSWIDALARALAISGISIPQFWLGLLLIYGLSFKLKLFPMMGSGGPLHLALPALTLAVGPAAMLTRLVRANMLELMSYDFVRVAYAKGLAEPRVLLKHVLRPALIPVVTLIALQMPIVFGGAIVTEQIFRVPGIGSLLISAMLANDTPVIMAVTFVFSCLVVLCNLIADILYAWLDPRIAFR